MVTLQTVVVAVALGILGLVVYAAEPSVTSAPPGAGATHGPVPTCFREVIGDWDGDGNVNVDDAFQLLREEAGLPPTVHVHCGWMDATCDDEEDIRDVIAILLNLAGLPFEQVAGRYCVCLGERTGPIGYPPSPPTPTPVSRLCLLD